jgi:hypothetical protein
MKVLESRVVLCVLLAQMASGVLAAQTTDAADPIRCWWRTSAGAVAIGEPFDATLTCAVGDQESVRTVADESRLAAAVIQLAPFEILGGAHPADLRSATHRFFQYHYSLRIIERDVIGHDARFPDLQIPYRVHTRVNGQWAEGRDRTYIMPGRPIRVLSLVPIDADDIRDSSGESFARVEALRFRSRVLEIASIASLLLGAIVAAPAVIALARRRTNLGKTDEGRLSRRLVLSTAQGELDAVAAECRGGWTPDLAARALNAFRLTAACALRRDVSHHPPTSEGGSTGRLIATRGWLRRRQVAISSAVTALDVQRAIAALPLTTPHDERQLVDDIHQAITALTRAVYGATFREHETALDEAFASARTVAQRLGRQR